MLRSTLFAGLSLLTSAAWAFGPDICLLTNGEVANCTPLPEACAPGDESLSCVQATSTASGAVSDATEIIGGKRSMVHFDFTFYAAQFIGLSRNKAYYVAAYNDATDLGRYIPRNSRGKLLADPADCDAGIDNGNCKWLTKPIMGFNKVNIASGGLFYHFHAPFTGRSPAPASELDGLHPNTDSPTQEQFLSHVRRWADGSNGIDLLCAHGLTVSTTRRGDYAYGSECYGADSLLAGVLNVSDDVAPQQVIVPYAVRTGAQIVDYVGGFPIDSTTFDAYIGSKAKWARIGIYLHAFQDRVSHYKCIDDSFMNGPITGAPAAFLENMASAQCDQFLHVARHAWEAGVDQSLLAPEDRTLEAGLRGSFAELLDILVNMGLAQERALDPVQQEAFIADMLTALQITSAYERMTTMQDLAVTRYGLQEMPGY